VPRKLVDGAVDFHGHLGPFLILGLKAGLYANSILGKDCFKTTAFVKTDTSPPYSCFVDGVQFVTGCTMGKGNVKLRKGAGLSVCFLKEGKSLKLKLKKKTLDLVRTISSEDSLKQASLNLMQTSVDELFEIER
jgi:formylmethanofuran dehydrogenase subunit E